MSAAADPFKIQKDLQAYPEGAKVLLLAPVNLKEFSVADLLRQGFFRIYRYGEMQDLAQVQDDLNTHEPVRIVIDRLIIKNKALGARLLESIRNALVLGNGVIEVLTLDGKPTGEDADESENIQRFQNEYACLNCHKTFIEPFANLFSFNSPMGACPSCEGFGRIISIDLDKVIPNKNLTLAQGAINPFTKPSYTEGYDYLAKEAKKRKIPLDVPWNQLTDAQKAFVIDGGGDFDGIRGFFDWLETKKYKVHVRVMLAKYRGYSPCPDCLGSRLRREALNVFIQGKNILALGEMPVLELEAFFDTLALPPTHELIAARLLKEIQSRLHYLSGIGLTYLTLSRQFRTLSNGEAQRINLSAALGSGLTDTLYVLDEPTVGLHARDTDRLIRILQNLRDHGNTIVIVEHDPDVMLAADYIVDMGPAGGEEGGRIVYEGTPKGLLAVNYSLTARYLNNPALPPAASLSKKSATPSNGNGKASKAGKGKAKASASAPQDVFFEDAITIEGARGNNLKDLTVHFPKNQLVCVTGVSGSGKSTLIKQTLFAAYEHSQSRSLQLDEEPHDAILGLESFKDVLLVDQSPPGRSARSNPVTYVKAYDDIRKLFSESRKAMILGIGPGHFSFNTTGGRCETCEGLGTLTIDMQFMADVTVVCHDCQGRRFNPNVLSVEVEGKNINDVLNLTVDESIEFFKSSRKIVTKLKPLQEIGLGYLKLGQSTSTLSGGEAQRLKLASYLPAHHGDDDDVSEAKDKYLFLFDEPTTGLHMADIALLVQAFRRLIAAGHSLIVIEHNIDFIAQTDYIVDLGPEGGEGGGQIVATGNVAEVMESPRSETGKFLKQRLETPTQASIR
jgi:excinuclease ABC subunit A